MTILFVLLTFIVIMAINYYTRRDRPQPAVEAPIFKAVKPRVVRDLGFEIPVGYAFHPGHTWVADEGRQNARIGIDKFAANLLGKVDQVEVTGLNRWVRQGQKVLTAITPEGVSVDMVAPVEGVVIAINPELLRTPDIATRDPFNDGWVCMIKSPDLDTNKKNLISGSFVAPWMQNSVSTVNGLASAKLGATAQDGGVPVPGLLGKLDADTQKAVIREVFLTER